MLARTALWASAGAMMLSLVFGALSTFGVGLSAPTPLPDDVSQRILHRFLTAEETYMAWGRWVDLTTALGFGALLIALPSLVADGGRRLILSAGAALAVAGDAIDLSQLVAYETARVGLDNGLGDTFAAGNVFRFAINTTSAYVWIAGLLLLGVGFFLMARHAAQPQLRAVLGLVAAALVVQAITDPIGGDVATIIFKGASTVFVLAFVSWVAITAPRMSGEPMLAAG